MDELVSHPAFVDPSYRARRDHIAALARADQREIPRIGYEPGEHDVWARVRARIDPLHARHACARVRQAQRRVPLDRDRIPQLADVSAALASATGFRLAPVPGLVAPGPFFTALGQGCFLATQYVRHAATPLYTPEPDVIHELVGHVPLLADPDIAELARRFGSIAARADPIALVRIARVFWFSLEFGMCREHGEARVLGAGLLSSITELEHAVAGAILLPFDPEAMAATDYDTQAIQPRLFVADDFDALVGSLHGWLDRNADISHRTCAAAVPASSSS